MITAKNLQKSFNDLHVLKGVSLHIDKGEIVSIVGASGAGKTTLLQILGTLEGASDGLLEVDGVAINLLQEKELARFRNQHVGFIFQFHQLLPEFTALENVCIPGFIAKRPKKEVEQKAKELLDLLGLSDRYTHFPNALSGGEQQRVAVARALINNPAVIFADEPSGNLDSESAQKLHELFFSLREKLGQTFVIVTHNKELAAMSDRTLTMKDGKILENA